MKARLKTRVPEKSGAFFYPVLPLYIPHVKIIRSGLNFPPNCLSMRTNIDTMKKIMLALLSLIISLAGFSQVKKDRSKMSDSTKQSIKEVMKTKKGKKMAELNLSREQKKQVKEIKQNDDAAKNAILNDAALSEEQKKEKLKELRKARQEKIKTMLTPEQKEKLKNMSQKP